MNPTNSNYGLGYKGPTNSPSKEKGTEAAFQDLDYLATGVKSQLSNMMVNAVWVRQTGATAIAPGSCVKWSVPGSEIAAVAGSNEAACGVVDPYLTSSVAQNEYCWVIYKGPARVIASAAISANAAIKTAASGKVATTDYTDVEASVGRLITAAGADGDVRRALIDCRNI